MTDKVQKIKEWISKEQDGLMDAQGNFEYPEHEGAYHILCNLDAYIDSLQEKPKLEGVEKEVAEGLVARINRKRIPIELKGEIKAKFKNEFHTIWQIIDGIQFANVAKYIIERICLHFATWGVYHLKDYIGMSDNEKAKMDSLQEEPVSKGRDIFDNCIKSEEKFILPQKISGNINCENCLYSSACALGDIQECIIDKPVSEDLKKASIIHSEIVRNTSVIDEDFIDGAKWQKQHLWKYADGRELPEIDRGVICLLDCGKVVKAHRPSTKNNLCVPETYGKGGWSYPNIKYWLDVELPKEIEL